jgi:two-component system, LytTR family, response regulator
VTENARLRVVIADDERPARALLSSILRSYEDVEVVGEAADGAQCVELIEALIAFVTAYDEFAVRAFDVNAVDYVLKPVDPARIRQTINRALDRLERRALQAGDVDRVRAAAAQYAAHGSPPMLRRLPMRKRDDIVLVPVDQIMSVVADGELLHVTTRGADRYTITYRLKDLELRLDPTQFIRISRGTLVNIGAIAKITPMPGGTYQVTLQGGAHHQVSRLRGRVIRDQLLRI